MPNTYSQIYIQIVFAVKGRQNLIREDFREELQKYITGIVEGKNTKLIAIYCMPDHVHVFVGIKPAQLISDLVKDIKVNSTNFINDKKFTKQKFSWQEGFGAFSYSHSHINNVVKYIRNQKEHHAKTNFQAEYTSFLEKFDIQFEERYLFEWV